MEMCVTDRKDDGHGTLGALFVDAQYECDTLEPSIAAEHPRIPAGRYAVEFRFSPRFQMVTPHILDVPGRDFILIHPGNKPEDTEGCLLVGAQLATKADWVGQSRIAFLSLMTLIRECPAGELFITFDEAN